MNHSITSHGCLSIIITLGVACSTERNQSGSPLVESDARVVEPMDDQFESPPPRDTVPRVMQAKLAHSQAILEGLALRDFPIIENNALALKRISQHAEWLVHDSVAYFNFSAEFRLVCDDLAEHARSENLVAAGRDYSVLANSCIACHDYLRRERQTLDMPGRISMIDPMR